MRIGILILLLAVLLTGFSACNAGAISKEQYSSILSELDELRDKLNNNDSDGASINEQQSSAFEQDLIQHAIYLTNEMIAVASDSDYFILLGQPDYFEYVSAFTQLEDVPGRAIIISFSVPAMNKMTDDTLALALALANDGVGASSITRTNVRRALMSTIPNFIYSKFFGIEYMAATSVIQRVESFQITPDSTFPGYSLVFLIYDAVNENAENFKAVSCVTFRESMNQTLIGTTCFLGADNDELTTLFNDDESKIWRNIIKLLNSIDTDIVLSEDGVACSVYEGRYLQSIVK